MNSRNLAVTGTSLYFMMHGWHLDLVDLETTVAETQDLPIARADCILQKLLDVCKWAQSAMAMGQQRQEERANRRRDKAMLFCIRDKV